MSRGAHARRRAPTLLIGLVALLLFAAIAWGVLGSGALAGWDRQALAWLRDQTEAPLRGMMRWVSNAHRPRGILAASALALAALLWRRERAAALWLLCAVGGGAALNDAVKHAVQRPRPGNEGLWVLATDYSFPSGHVANATLLYGALALLWVGRLHSPALRAAVWLAVAGAVALVAASRLVLGAHYPSDVVAGAALAAAWLALCHGALQRWPRGAVDG